MIKTNTLSGVFGGMTPYMGISELALEIAMETSTEIANGRTLADDHGFIHISRLTLGFKIYTDEIKSTEYQVLHSLKVAFFVGRY